MNNIDFLLAPSLPSCPCSHTPPPLLPPTTPPNRLQALGSEALTRQTTASPKRQTTPTTDRRLHTSVNAVGGVEEGWGGGGREGRGESPRHGESTKRSSRKISPNSPSGYYENRGGHVFVCVFFQRTAALRRASLKETGKPSASFRWWCCWWI